MSTGVGRNLASRLHALDVRACSDLQCFTQSQLQKEFGAKIGNALYRHCRGKDDRVLNFGHQRKSVSAEVNYGIRFTNQEEAAVFIKQLAGEVSSRLKKVRSKGRCITLKLMVRISIKKLFINKCYKLYHSCRGNSMLTQNGNLLNHFSSFRDEGYENATSNICYISVLIKIHSL